MEEVVVMRRRHQLEANVQQEPLNYDTWFDYPRLEEQAGDVARTREVYERAIANKPPILEKRYWKRYIYLWLNYALFEEVQAENGERAGKIYELALSLIPHESFTFAKLWILYA